MNDIKNTILNLPIELMHKRILMAYYEDTNSPITKGLGFIIKEPDFKEDEHPRDEDGKFKDKNSASSSSNTTSNVKTTTSIQKHGGRRPNAGRLPTDAHNAVPIVMERIKKENPDWTHEQVKEEITRQAIERGKPDWDEYVNNPDEYMKKLKQEAEDIKKTTYNKTYVGKTKISGNVSSSEVAQIKSQVAISRSTFDKDVTLMGDIKETWDHYRSGRMNEDDVHRVKLGVAVASAAVLLGTIGWLRKAKFNKAGLHTYDLHEGMARQEIAHARANRFKEAQEITLDKANFKVETPHTSSSVTNTPGEGNLLPSPSTPKRATPTKQKFKINEENRDFRLSHVGGMDNIGDVPLQNPTLYRIVEISTPTGLVAQTPAFDKRLNAFSGEFSGVMGKINVGLTSFMKRLKYAATQKGENPIGKKYATVKGEWLAGFRARFSAGKLFHIDRFPLDENGVRRAVHLDIDREFTDLLTGIQVTRINKEGKFVLNEIGIFNSKKMWENFIVGGKHIPGQPIVWKPNAEKLLDKMGLKKGEHWESGAGMVVNIKDPEKFKNVFNEIKSHTSEQQLLPRFLSAYRTETEMDTAAKKYKAVKGLEDFIENNVLPMTFSKAGAYLVPFAGATSAIAYRIVSTANVYNEAGADQRQREDQMNTAKEEVKSEQERLRRNRTIGNTKAEVNRLRRAESTVKRSEADTKRKEAANVEARKIQQENAEAERAKKAQESMAKNQEVIDQTG